MRSYADILFQGYFRRSARIFTYCSIAACLITFGCLFNSGSHGPITGFLAPTSKTNTFSYQPRSLLRSENGSILDGCYHIFLDVGANIGITVRKLFEPHLYPDAKFLTYFDQQFGSIKERKEKLALDSKYICAVGFEPNPIHVERLHKLETAYGHCGWNVYFYKNMALSDKEGTLTFYKVKAHIDKKDIDRIGNVIGLSFRPTRKSDKTSTVNSSRLSDFMFNHVLNRQPNKREQIYGGKPRILMKMDAESSEIEIFYDLIINGLMTQIHQVRAEYHHPGIYDKTRRKRSENLEAFLNQLVIYCAQVNEKGEKFCDFDHRRGEDESFYQTEFLLPNCLQ